MVANASPESLTLQTSVRDNTKPLEWAALLECAAPNPNLERLAGLVQDCRWPHLLQQAEDHGLTPLLAERVNNLDQALVPLEVRDKLRELQRAQTLFTLPLTAELFRVLERFTSSGIEILVTKGPALAMRCYGDPGMRQYGDLDLIVRQTDIRRATQIMIERGYQPRVPLTAIDAGKIPGEYSFAQPTTGFLLEFHTERTFRYHPRRLNIDKVLQHSDSMIIDGRKVPVLSLEDELILICIHGTKHFWERLMWIADVAALVWRQLVDWERALAAAGEVRAERILFLGLRLASDLLGADLPPQIKARVRADRVAARLAAQIESNFARSEARGMDILQRAAFRIRMRGGFLPGLGYLLRLSLSPTEEDWTPGKEGTRPAFIEAIRRPLRLAKKHSRHSGK